MIRGHARNIPELKNDAKLNVAIHNRFDIEVVESTTGKIKQRAQAENVILNALWARLGTAYFSRIMFGSGSGAPSATDTALFTYVGNKSAGNILTAFDTVAGTYSARKQIQLLENEYVGTTLTEVGLGYNDGASYLVTHAMLKDMNGNQISIAKTGTDIINIYATVYAVFYPSYQNESIRVVHDTNLYNDSTAYILQMIVGVTALNPNGTTRFQIGYGQGLDPRESVYEKNGVGSVFTWSIDGALKKITGTAVRLPAADGNNIRGYAGIYVAGILFTCTDSGGWYNGTDISAETVGIGDGTTTDFDLMYPYASNARIYVDGVEDINATVYTLLHKNYFGSEMNAIDSAGNFILYPKPSGDHYNDGYNDRALYYENPYYLTIGITKVKKFESNIYVSDDLVTWAQISGTNKTVINVPTEHQHKRYWRAGPAGLYNRNGMLVPADGTTIGKAIHFSSPPPSGAIITADYHTKSIAKDANHVFDFSFTIQLGEYTE